jgi:hypothetical protein
MKHLLRKTFSAWEFRILYCTSFINLHLAIYIIAINSYLIILINSHFVAGALGSFFGYVPDAFSGRSPSLPSEQPSSLPPNPFQSSYPSPPTGYMSLNPYSSLHPNPFQSTKTLSDCSETDSGRPDSASSEWVASNFIISFSYIHI